MMVTALSAALILEGRQMCSSTPMVLICFNRSGRLTSSLAACAIAFQQVSQATPSRRARADTVVSSCRSASTAHVMARAVSLARGAAKGCCSVHVRRGQAGSGQRQIRFNHRTRTGRPKARCVVQHLDSPAMTGRDHATVGTAGQGLIGLYVDTDKALVVTADVE